jgi:hypothetical protein
VVDQYGQSYASSIEAAQAVGCNPASLAAVLSGRRRAIKGYVFKRLANGSRVNHRVEVARAFIRVLKEVGAPEDLIRMAERIASSPTITEDFTHNQTTEDSDPWHSKGIEQHEHLQI